MYKRQYPKAVETAADKIPAEITPEEIAKREDFRKVTTFTIDPKDAKDFDDALSIRPIKDGLWEVGVHIADVTPVSYTHLAKSIKHKVIGNILLDG